jgi:hypothetical protein
MDNLTRLRSGLISKPFLGKNFLDWWISSLEVSHANHFPTPVSELEMKIPDICSHTYWKELESSDLPLFSLRMLKESSQANCLEMDGMMRQELQFCTMSCANWSVWVTKQRQEYSVRLSAALFTNENECLSWPTASTRDHKGGYNGGRIRDGKISMDTLDVAVQAHSTGGLLDPVNPNTHGSHPESWSTPTVTDASAMSPEMRPSRIATGRTTEYLARQIQWATPRAGKTTDENPETWALRQAKGDVATMPLTSQVKAWPTPDTQTGPHGARGISSNLNHQSAKSLEAIAKTWATPQTRDNRSGGAERWDDPNRSKNLNDQIASVTTQNAKLNPRWVETLMGLPVGWTMPSCSHPIVSPANAVMTLSAGNAEDTTQTVHALGHIAMMTDNRTDELRLLGNGVVPATAELAFKTLIQQL